MPNYPYSFQLPPLNVQDIPNDGVAGEFLGISAGGVLDWLPVATGGGDMLKSENLSGLTSYPTARTNLGLGTGDSPTFANLTLTSPSLASSAPVTISQTWGTTGTYTAAKVNVTETATANPASLLLDLQLGGVTQVNSTKAGSLFARIFVSGNSQTSRAIEVAASGIAMGSLGVLAFAPASSYASNSDLFNVADTFLRRDGAANTLALRNGAAAQTFNVYGTYTSASVYERMFMRYNGTDLAFQVGAETLGATARPLQLWTGGASRLHITTAGNVGIGTTAPSEKLHVLGGKVLFGDATDVTGTAGNGDLTLRAWRAPQLNMVANTSSGEVFGLNLKNGATTLAGITLNIGSGEVKIGGFWTGGYFPTFYSNNVERMRIDTGGNVGIGTTSPTSKLHVVGDARITTDVFASAVYGFAGANTTCGINGSDGVGPIIHANQNGKIGFFSGTSFSGVMDTVLVRDGEADHLAMRRSTNGQKFSVYGTYPGANWERFTITAPTSGNVLLGTYKGTGGIARGLEFQTDGVTRMTLNAAGTAVIFPSGMALQRTDGGGVIFDFTYNGVQFANTDGLGVSWSTITGPASLKHVGVYGYTSEPGVVQVNSSVKGTLRDLRCRSVIEQPPASITPTLNGDLVVEATSNTTLTFKLKGTDGTVRTGTITLA